MNRFAKIFLALLVLAALIFFLYSIAGLVRLLIVSALLAYILEPLASRMEARGLKRSVATLVIFIGIILIVAGFALLILPTLSSEVKAIQNGFSSGKAQDMMAQLQVSIQDRLKSLGIENFDLTAKLQSLMATFGQQVLTHLMDAVSLVTNLVIIPFIMFFLIKDGRAIKKSIINLVPNRYFELSLNLLYKMDQQLGNYLRGQFMDALIIGILSIAALWILGINYFVLIGAFAGLANLIPYVGPIAGAVPAIIVSVMQTGSFDQVAWIALAFVIVQLLDNVVVQPVVVAQTVNLHPLLVLLVVIIGGQFFGILGMLLAVPATGVIKVVVEESYRSIRKYHFS